MEFKVKLIVLILSAAVVMLLEMGLLASIRNSKEVSSNTYHMHVVSIYENSASKNSPLFAFPSCPSAPHTVTLHVFTNSNNTNNCIQQRFGCERLILKFYDSKLLQVESTSTHYSAASANKKLKLLEFFQHKIPQFLYLDMDTFLVHGFDGLIYAWKYFDLFKQNEFIGMVKEYSSFYNYESYNSGVFLVDVNKSLKYPWKKTLEASIKEAGVTALADQDVFNTLDRRMNGTWIHTMDCGLNFANAGFPNCQTRCVRIVHFNAMSRIERTPRVQTMLDYIQNSTLSAGCENTLFPRHSLFEWVENSKFNIFC